MKRIILFSLAWIALHGCAPSATVRSGQQIAADLGLPPYNGPRIPVAVGPCEDKTAGVSSFRVETAQGETEVSIGGEIGRGIADMMVTALVNSGRYVVLEANSAALDAMERERQLQDPSAAAGDTRAAHLMITCAVTEFQPQASGVGGGALAGIGGFIGGLFGGARKSTVGLDFRLSDIATREIVSAFSVHGEASALGGAALGAGSRALGAIGAFSDPGIEKAVRIAIEQAVREIVNNTPQRYFERAGANLGTPPDGLERPAPAANGDPGSHRRLVSVTARALNLRAEPTTESAVLTSLPQHTRLEVLEERDGWYLVSTPEGQHGWVSARYARDIS